MQYSWAKEHAFETASIPRAVAQQMKLASAPQLRVLLWLACAGQGQFDAEVCAAACGVSPAVCEECVRYWVGVGVVTTEGDVATTIVKPSEAMPVVTEVTSPPAKGASVFVAPLLTEKTTVADRPSREEALRVKAQDGAFAMLLDTAASKLGKMLSPSDISLFLYLYRDLALPVEVILMIIGYAVQNGKGKMAYIEKTALGWVQDGINTFEAADAHLRRLEQRARAWDMLCEWRALADVRPTVAQKEAACRWIFEWELPREVIEAVLDFTIEKTGKLQFSYADRVAERLHACGIKTAQAAKAELTTEKAPAKKTTSRARMKTANDRAPSYDIAEYEKMVRRHRPTPPKED